MNCFLPFEQLKHHRALRPNLGHPHLNPDLQALVDAEEERKVKKEEGLDASFNEYKVSIFQDDARQTDS